MGERRPNLRLTDELRACLHAIIGNPLHPQITAEHAESLIALGLAIRCGNFLAITQAGREAAELDPSGTS